MTFVCNENDMQKLLLEIRTGCLNEHDLLRIEDALLAVPQSTLFRITQALNCCPQNILRLEQSGVSLITDSSGSSWRSKGTLMQAFREVLSMLESQAADTLQNSIVRKTDLLKRQEAAGQALKNEIESEKAQLAALLPTESSDSPQLQ